MENYLYISTSISVFVLLLIKYGHGTSVANYYLSAFAIVSWMIPYPYLAELIPKDILVDSVVSTISHAKSVSSTVQNVAVEFNVEVWVSYGFSLLLLIGIFLMLVRSIQTIRWLSKIHRGHSLLLNNELTSKHRMPIYFSDDVSSGLLLGVISPKIIISTSIIDTKSIDLIIAHEKQHLANNDNIRLILLEIIDCLFWWNFLVRKLVIVNRFYIEARCDENASTLYGKPAYISDLTSLVLENNHGSHNEIVCNVTSKESNNIARIKLLMEQRKMTLRNKLTYVLIAILSAIVIFNNTIATAAIKEQNAVVANAESDVQVSFYAIITNNKTGNKEDTFHHKLTFEINYDEVSVFTIGDDVSVSFKANDLGEFVALSLELVDSSLESENVIARPKLNVGYGAEATIEFYNPDVSEYFYSIKATTNKVTQVD